MSLFSSASRDKSARRHRFNGFTLVELLVVIGIIALLISILMPTLQKARISAQKTACLANIRSVVQSMQIYAAQSKGSLPASINKDGSQWCYSFDLKVSANPALGGMGLGLLLDNKILDTATAGKMLHDPAMDTTGGAALGEGGHCMDEPPTSHWWGLSAGVSYFDSSTTARIICAYNYRWPSYYNTHQQKPPKLGSVKSDLLLMMDMPDPRFGRLFTHKDGYNFVRIDGSGGWFSDKTGIIDKMAGQYSTMDGMNDPVRDENVYTYIEKNY